MGYYVRQQHEMLLIATKGSPGAPEPARRPASVFYEQRREHSRKPDCVIQALEVMYPDLDGTSRCELFQREPRPGWSGWGNEVGCGLEPRELEV